MHETVHIFVNNLPWKAFTPQISHQRFYEGCNQRDALASFGFAFHFEVLLILHKYDCEEHNLAANLG